MQFSRGGTEQQKMPSSTAGGLSAKPQLSGLQPAAAQTQPEKKTETALQRETRLTGRKDLCSWVDNYLTKFYHLPSNATLARKVISLFCQAKTSQDFHRRVSSYVGSS